MKVVYLGTPEFAVAPLMEIAKSRNCLSKGNELDYSKAAVLLIDDFRSGNPKLQECEWEEGGKNYTFKNEFPESKYLKEVEKAGQPDKSVRTSKLSSSSSSNSAASCCIS